MEEAGIAPIDVVVVNLYPFTKYLESDRAQDAEKMTELVDVGGPTMIRAAAKNHRFVLPLIDPSDYSAVIEQLATAKADTDPFSLEFRRTLAAKVFGTLSAYDAAISGYFFSVVKGREETGSFPATCTVSLTKQSDLRYGENPHQKAALYTATSSDVEMLTGPRWTQLGGKELSYNNMLDLDAAVRLLSDLPTGSPVVAILKHLNPCGVARGVDVSDAIQRAKQCDPRSHFGGIVVINREVDRNAAEQIREDFAELVVAPSFSEQALSVLRTSKNLRILQIDGFSISGYEVRSVIGGLLVQQPDINRSQVTHAMLASSRTPTDDELADLDLAWRIVGHVKSNAIVLVRDGLLVGVGAGQMSRVDSVELAIKKAKLHGHLLDGAVAASDAFFPFADSIETLSEVGVTAVVSPAGSRRDSEVQEAADARGVSLFFTSDRHFRH
jgi:phosphoribosylaminoimidazolecarboxamide formyltransferase/IMP cyclohydrolase